MLFPPLRPGDAKARSLSPHKCRFAKPLASAMLRKLSALA